MSEKGDFFGFRHQEANYKLNKRVLESERPQGPVKADDQEFDSDLTEKGKREAKEEAERFFQQFDPAQDAFFFVSSNFVRSIETGKIYLETAEENGFEIIFPENPSDQTVARVGEGKIRHIDALSLKIDDAVLDQLFNPKSDYLKLAEDRGVHFDPNLVRRWNVIRKQIEADNKGTWSENWRHHSQAAKEVLPEIQTAKEMFDTQFKSLLKLMEFGRKKIEASNHKKKIRVLAFTHENLFTHWLAEEWNESGLKPGESVAFYFDIDKNLQANVRGNEKTV